jgi:ammonia channel protein AmtB
MVSMCGGCNLYEPWAAVVVGLIAGSAYMAVHLTMLRFQAITKS